MKLRLRSGRVINSKPGKLRGRHLQINMEALRSVSPFKPEVYKLVLEIFNQSGPIVFKAVS